MKHFPPNLRKGWNKYGAKKATCLQGHTHDSRLEARTCDDLTSRERRGEISNLQRQVKFRFVIDGRDVKLKNGHVAGVTVDFQFFEGVKNVVVETKGFVVRDWPLRRAIFTTLFPHIEFREVNR